ncbi:hypothetical protein QTP88_007118 [Uroleucon formosanum]
MYPKKYKYTFMMPRYHKTLFPTPLESSFIAIVDMRLSSYQYKNASMLHLFLIVIKYCLNCLDT